MNNIKHIVYTSDLDIKGLIGNYQGELIKVLDPRSAIYVATGIAAQNQETVIVIMNSSNTSRSAFSGMTEAFYRNLPLILITIGKKLDYTQELNDVVNSHFVISTIGQIDDLINNKMPIHIELDTEYPTRKKKMEFSGLGDAIRSDDYLYISQNILINSDEFSCKLVKGGMLDCDEGAMANVLGASLAKKRRRYIGLITETEFLHDMNTLGNIHINDSLVYIVLVNEFTKMIVEYATSLGFMVSYFKKYETKDIKKILENGKKSIVLIEE